MNSVEKHPQRQQIIDQILAGTSLRSIARSSVPPLNHVTLSRFKLQVLTPAVQNMRGKTAKHNVIKTVAAATGMTDDGPTAVTEAVKREIQDKISSLDERFERWISEAEQGVFTDSLGNPLKDSDGTVLRRLEHRALAAHAKNSLSSLEFRAKLNGLLQDGTSLVQLQITLAGPADKPELPPAIDVKAIRQS